MKTKSQDKIDIMQGDDATAARRSVLGSTAAIAAGMAMGLLAVACGTDDDDKDSDQDSGTPGGNNGNGNNGNGNNNGNNGEDDAGSGKDAGTADADIEPLNALLTAEYNAITAYTAGAGVIMGAKMTDPLYALRTVIVDIAVDIQSQHKLHALALVDALKALGGKPVVEAEVAAKFVPPKGVVDNPTIANVLKFAASAERDAAVAYNQVLAGLEDAKHRFLASAIEGDESQHFIVLAALVLGLAGPGANLSSATAGNVVPEAFVTTVGDVKGLDKAPPDYFA